MKQLLLILFFIIVSCSFLNKEYNEVVSTNTYKITNRIQIARVHFDFNKFNLTRDFIENSILTDLRTNKNILKLYIEGHTDNKGKDWYNYRLGLQRALTISNIISTNYPSENIILKSFSYSNSIADNRTENGRSNNRRADIFIDLVEETFEIQTNLIKVDKVNKFNIDLTMLLIILLLILLLIIIIILMLFIYYNFSFMISFIQKVPLPKFFKKIIKNNWFRKLKESLKKASNTTEKGNIGEQFTALDKVLNRGWNLICPKNIPKNMKDKGHQGIDSIFEKNGGFIIVDSKYGSSKLIKTDDGKQMCKNWIRKRLKSYCGANFELYNKIKDAFNKGKVKSMVSEIDENLDNTIYKLLDKSGNYIFDKVNKKHKICE